MKKLLLASTALVLSAGVAAADVAVSGVGRMGIVDTFGPGDIAFTSRIRIAFRASGQTDGGLTFGGVIRADNAPGGSSGTDGSVFISGAFGRLTMGDVSGAPEAAVGDVSGVGLTNPGDLNAATYLSNSARPAMRYDYTTGAFGVHISADNPAVGDAYGLAVTYNAGAYKFGIGYEASDDLDVTHIIAGGSATFGDATVKAFYGTADAGGTNLDQWGLSVDYTIDALTLTVFYTDKDDVLAALGDNAGYGIGASYDLGGGASLKGGYLRDETAGEDAFDFGIDLTF